MYKAVKIAIGTLLAFGNLVFLFLNVSHSNWILCVINLIGLFFSFVVIDQGIEGESK